MKLIRFAAVWGWIFYMFGCGAVQCKKAQVALWQDANEPEYKYKITVRCHDGKGHSDIDVVKSKSVIKGCKGVSDGK